MSAVYVVVDVGCLECGISSEPVGIYANEVEADLARAQREEQTGGWRDGGPTDAQVFEMDMP